MRGLPLLVLHVVLWDTEARAAAPSAPRVDYSSSPRRRTAIRVLARRTGQGAGARLARFFGLETGEERHSVAEPHRDGPGRAPGEPVWQLATIQFSHFSVRAKNRMQAAPSKKEPWQPEGSGTCHTDEVRTTSHDAVWQP